MNVKATVACLAACLVASLATAQDSPFLNGPDFQIYKVKFGTPIEQLHSIFPNLQIRNVVQGGTHCGAIVHSQAGGSGHFLGKTTSSHSNQTKIFEMAALYFVKVGTLDSIAADMESRFGRPSGRSESKRSFDHSISMRWGFDVKLGGRLLDANVDDLVFDEYVGSLGFARYALPEKLESDIRWSGFSMERGDAAGTMCDKATNQQWRTAAAVTLLNDKGRKDIDPVVRRALTKRILRVRMYLHREYAGVARVEYYAFDPSLFVPHADAVREAAGRNDAAARKGAIQRDQGAVRQRDPTR